MRVYATFVVHYSDTLSMILELSEKKQKFIEFLDEVQGNSSTSQILSYLIMPVQRLPRYELFLQQLVKSSHEKHPDHKNISLALHQIQRLNSFINEEQAHAEKIRTFLAFQRNYVVGKTVDVAIEGRRLIKGDTLSVYLKGKAIKYHYVFFSDVFLLFGPDKLKTFLTFALETKYKIEEMSPYTDIEVVNVPDTEELKNAFEIVIKGCKYTIVQPTLESKLKWMEDISEIKKSGRSNPFMERLAHLFGFLEGKVTWNVFLLVFVPIATFVLGVALQPLIWPAPKEDFSVSKMGWNGLLYLLRSI